MEKIMGIFDRRPLIWFHYVLLTVMLFAGFYIGESYLGLSSYGTFGMFIFWFIVLSISDQLIHHFLGVD